MELGVRDWMIIVGILLILAVLLDGYRRVRNERRGNIRMSLNKQFINAGAADEANSSELPNGGARSISRNKGDADEILGLKAGSNGELDFKQSVPILMESIADKSLAEDIDQSIEAHIEAHIEVESFTATSDTVSQVDIGKEQGFTASSDAEIMDTTDTSDASIPNTTVSDPQPHERVATSTTQSEEVMVINVIAKDKPFKGPDLLHILLACDLRFGDMNIFHRHEQTGGNGAVQFSMANSVEPGIFNLDTIDDFTTPGVCFFMSVPGPEKPIEAFEFMVETAQCLATNLEGELLDESRSAMTNQTLEHCRQRLHDFERRQLTHA